MCQLNSMLLKRMQSQQQQQPPQQQGSSHNSPKQSTRPLPPPVGHTYRGLENQTSNVQKKDVANSISLVLNCYDGKAFYWIDNPDTLATLYGKFTRGSKLLALSAGLQDEIDAFQQYSGIIDSYWNNTNNNNNPPEDEGSTTTKTTTTTKTAATTTMVVRNSSSAGNDGGSRSRRSSSSRAVRLSKVTTAGIPPATTTTTTSPFPSPHKSISSFQIRSSRAT